jgi:hypothetical protein
LHRKRDLTKGRRKLDRTAAGQVKRETRIDGQQSNAATVRSWDGYVASWNTSPSMWRSPDRMTDTPCRTGAADHPRAERTGPITGGKDEAVAVRDKQRGAA